MSTPTDSPSRCEPEPDSGPPPAATTDPLLDRFDLNYLLRRYFNLLVIVPAICGCLALAYYFVRQPLFKSSALIYIDPKFDRIIQFENEANGGNQNDLDSLKSLEIAMVGSSMVLRVVDTLGLRDEGGFLPKGMAGDPDLPDDKLVAFLQAERFRAGLVEETRLLEVSVLDPDPERSRLIADTFASEFGRFLVERRQSEALAARSSLEGQAEKAREAARAAEETLGEFRASHPEFPVEQDHDLYAQRVTQFSDELNTVVRQRLELESQVEVLAEVGPHASPIAVIELAGYQAMAHVSDLLSQRATAEAALAAAGNQLGVSNPKYKAAQAQFDSNEKQLQDLAADVRLAVDSKYEATKKREAALRAELGSLQRGLVDMKALSSEFRALQQQVDREWLVHETIQKRLSESVIAEDAFHNIATVVSEPMTPSEKAEPKLALLGLIAIGASGILCAGWIGLRVLRGLPYSDREQLEQRLGFPVIADWADPRPGEGSDPEPTFLRLLAEGDTKAVQISAPALNGAGRSVAKSIAGQAAKAGARSFLVVVSPGRRSKGEKPECVSDGNLVRLEITPEEAVYPGWLAEVLRKGREQFDHVFLEAGGCDDPALERFLSSFADKNLVVVGKGAATKQEVDERVDRLAGVEMPPVSLMMVDAGGAPESGGWWPAAARVAFGRG